MSSTLLPQLLTTVTLLAPLILASPFPSSSNDNKTYKNNSNTQPIRIPQTQGVHGPIWNLTYGSPPQTITVLDDWTWHSTWLYSPHCKGEYSILDCVLPGQNFFDYENSSTFQADTTEADQTFGGTDYTPGAPFTVSFGADTMCLPSASSRSKSDKDTGTCAQGIEVELSDLAFEFPAVQDIGGIIGYAPVLPGYNATYLPFIYQFMQQSLLPSHTVGRHACTALKTKKTCDGADYLTVLGGTDTAVYNPREMIDHPIVVSPCVNAGNLALTPARDNYWSASWTGLWLGTTRISLAPPPTTAQPPAGPDPACATIAPIVIFDEGGMGRGAPVPLAAFASVVTATGATQINASAAALNPGKQGLYSVPCASVGRLPSFYYELSGKQNITVTPDMYVNREVLPGTCLLDVRVWDRATAGAQTFLGGTVIERTYLRFDFERLVVGVAEVRRELF